jgi:hypothetical protein
VEEPPELFRLKCASHRYSADTNSTHFKRNNPFVCRVSARYNHGSTGSNQVYLARRRVYNHSTAHQLLIHRILNIITNHFKLEIINRQCLKRQAKQLVQVYSGRENKSATTHVTRVDTILSPKLGVTQEGHCQPGTDPTPRTSQKEQKLAMQGCPWGSRKSYLKSLLARLSILILSKAYPLRGILSQVTRLMKVL